MNRVSALSIFYYHALGVIISFEKFGKLRDCYLSDYAYFKDINKYTWPDYGALWKLISVTG